VTADGEDAMQLSCKTCGKAIPAQDVNIDKAIAKCQACHAVFSFMDQVQSAPAGPRPPVPLPARMRIDNWGPELAITRSWYTHAVWFLLVFCIFWDGFLVVWYSVGVGAMLSGDGGGMAWVMLVFPVLHVVVGLGLTYLVICMFLNSTVVKVSMGELTVRHGPVPSWGNVQIRTSDLKQLYCTETINRTKNGCHTSYNVMAQTQTGDKIKLLTGLDQLDQGLFIEQQIEQHLRIRDERVPEEVRV
jgi:hypothetical protein